MALERIALISDVHGNLTALDAVLADIESRGIERIVNLGDYVGKGPRGSAVVDRCQKACEVNIRGNWDDHLPVWDDETSRAMTWWRDELRQDQRDWLRNLPLSHDLVVSGRQIRLFHASATSPHVRVRTSHTPEEFDGMFANTAMTGDGVQPSMVGYGDILRRTSRSRTAEHSSMSAAWETLWTSLYRATSSSRACSTSRGRRRSGCRSSESHMTQRQRSRSRPAWECPRRSRMRVSFGQPCIAARMRSRAGTAASCHDITRTVFCAQGQILDAGCMPPEGPLD